LTAEGDTVLTDMEASFGRWSERLVQKLGKENVLDTIEHLGELKDVLDADAEHFQTGRDSRPESRTNSVAAGRPVSDAKEA
jgi:hypothetical protein